MTGPHRDLLDRMALPPLARPYAAAVDTVICPTDAMVGAGHSDPVEHYLSGGASALNCLLAACALGKVMPLSILDFGCGAGRVTRWLRAAWPGAELHACDLRQDDVGFVGERFGARTFQASATPDTLPPAPCPFDLIWLGSVVTHLDATTTLALLRVLYTWLSPRGLLAVSLHGRAARAYGDAGTPTYLHADGWAEIRSEYDLTGYGYADYEGQKGYGVSLASPEWAIGLLDALQNAQIVLYGEALWDNHHDVIVLQQRLQRRRSFRQPGAEAML